MGKHEGPEERAIGRVGTLGFALAPRKQFGIRRAKRVPNLLDIIHGKTKSLPKGGFGEPRGYANTHAACRQFEQRITAIGIKPIHQFRQHRRCTRAACAAQHVNDFRHRRCDNVLADVWPHQGNRFRCIADIVTTHTEQHRVKPFLRHGANCGGFYR